MKEFFDTVVGPHHVGGALRGAFKFRFRVVEHSCAQAHASVVALENVVVDTALASGPEFLVVSKF